MPPAFSGCVFNPLAALPGLDRSWPCERSDVTAILPVDEAALAGTETESGEVPCADANTASCRVSRPAARNMTRLVQTFISGFLPLLCTVNRSSVLLAAARSYLLHVNRNKTRKVLSTPVWAPLQAIGDVMNPFKRRARLRFAQHHAAFGSLHRRKHGTPE